jgi:predicted dehydrogenase
MTTAAHIVQVGCGHWGKNLARNFAELGALAGVIDGDNATAERVAAEHGVPVCIWGEVLADPNVSGVALATPASTHAAMAQQALAAGKHVFVEKPLALLPEDGEQVVAAAAAAERVLMVGHLLHYHPIFMALRDMVRRGDLGRLQYIYSNRLSLGKFRTEENVWWSFAPHDVSMVLALAGETPTVTAAQAAVVVTPGVADWATCHMAFPSGLRAHVAVSWLHPFKEQRLVVVGDAATAVFEDSAPDWTKRLALYHHGIDRSGPAPVPVKAEAEYIVVPRGEPLRDECAHFLACIADGVTPRTDGVEALMTLRVLDAAEALLQQSMAGE